MLELELGFGIEEEGGLMGIGTLIMDSSVNLVGRCWTPPWPRGL